MIAGLSARDRRTLLVGVVAVFVIVCVGKGLPALQRWEQERVAAANETRQRLIVAERGAAALQDTRDSADVRDRRLTRYHSRMIVAASTDAACAALAGLLERLSALEDVSVGALTLRPDSVVRAGLARVGVRVSGEGDVNGLLGLLYATETHDTLMIVRDLSVSQPDPAARSEQREALRFELHVQTLARIAPDTAGRAQ